MPLADRRKIDWGYAADIDATVNANEDELRSLVHNLLDNALRYAPVGGIVDVTLHQDTGVATVELANNGPGIPPALLPRVCDRFFRIEDGLRPCGQTQPTVRSSRTTRTSRSTPH